MAGKATETAAAPAVVVKPIKLNERRFRLAEQVRQIWYAIPEAGTAFEALLVPEYWAHNAKQVRPSDVIEVLPDDSAYFARLLVTNGGNLGLAVQVLEYIELKAVDASAVSLSEEYRIDWAGGFHRFTVSKRRGGGPVKTGFDSADAANRWLAENALDLARRAEMKVA